MKTQENIANEFDEFAKDYTNDMIRCVPYYLELINSFSKHLPKNFQPTSVLDIGCGNGNTTAQLVSLFPNATYTLLDASSEMIELCKKRFKNHTIICENNYFKNFNFKENTYDLIIAGFSIHHCNEQEKQDLFKNIYKSLKKGGLFSCSDLMITKTNPNHFNLLKKWENFVINNYPNREKWEWLMDHYATFDNPTDYQKQIEWLTAVGFTKITLPFQEENYWVHLQAQKI
ncbi:class I SAM-dependent methyltransferase [Tenacibaculum crassostreae]|uniref:class I SAM-dependent methyltransferase n=1 Tax=Tenacibaculum crassostreae TaxID=502683 RepID=UPI0038938F5E